MNKSGNEPIRVLYINGGTMDMGGISSYMMNYYRHINHAMIQIDFVVHGNGGVYDDEIRKFGGEVIHIPTKREDYLGNVRALKDLFASGKYQIVHSHMDGMNGLALKLAMRAGVPCRISHSHNTEYLTKNPVKIVLHEHYRKMIMKYATELWACSEKAGNWLYGNSDFDVIKNAIEVEKFAYSPKVRNEYRVQMGLSDKFVVGHIGKFEYQKNHEFLINTFSKIVSNRKNAHLVLVGDGSLREKIQVKINQSGLFGNVTILGNRDDIPQLLNAFDVFVLPSKFEGLPVVAIEAQSNGLHCVCSASVTKETDASGNVLFLSLDDNINKWCEAINSVKERDYSAAEKMKQAGYDIISAAKILEERYENLYWEIKK